MRKKTVLKLRAWYPGKDWHDTFTVRGVHLSYIRDDCIKNGQVAFGLIENVLLDGCTTAISAPRSVTSVEERESLVIKQDFLIQMQLMEKVYKNRGLIPAHGGFFKFWELGSQIRRSSLMYNDEKQRTL